MRGELLRQLRDAGVDILRYQMEHFKSEFCFTSVDLAEAIDHLSLERVIREGLRDIRDVIQSHHKGWRLHTMTQDGFDAVARGQNLLEVDCAPRWGVPSVGLRMVTTEDDPTYALHCYYRDRYDNSRTNRHDKDTWSDYEAGLISRDLAIMQTSARRQALRTLAVNGDVCAVLRDIQRDRIRLRRGTKLKGISWVEFFGSREGLAAAPPTFLGYISANKALLHHEVSFYVRWSKQKPEFVFTVVREEFELQLLRVYLRDPDTTFPKRSIFDDNKTRERIRLRLGMGSSGPQ